MLSVHTFLHRTAQNRSYARAILGRLTLQTIYKEQCLFCQNFESLVMRPRNVYILSFLTPYIIITCEYYWLDIVRFVRARFIYIILWLRTPHVCTSRLENKIGRVETYFYLYLRSHALARARKNNHNDDNRNIRFRERITRVQRVR